jgi:hypothetical protein
MGREDTTISFLIFITIMLISDNSYNVKSGICAVLERQKKEGFVSQETLVIRN